MIDLVEKSSLRERTVDYEKRYQARMLSQGDQLFMRDDPSKKANVIVWAEKMLVPPKDAAYDEEAKLQNTAKRFVQGVDLNELPKGDDRGLVISVTSYDHDTALNEDARSLDKDSEETRKITKAVMEEIEKKFPAEHLKTTTWKGGRHVEQYVIHAEDTAARDNLMKEVETLLKNELKFEEIKKTELAR